MNSLKQYIEIIEEAQKTLTLDPLPYSKTALAPVMSKQTLDYHYSKLAKGYVDRYNKKEGDAKFNHNGAILHNIFFSQLTKASKSNEPLGTFNELIKQQYKSFEKFKQAVEDTAKTIQGSAWIYIDDKAKIHTIPNHDYSSSMKIVLLIDFWEHAWALDYQADKFEYLNNFWRIVNWTIVNNRLQ